MNRLDAMLERLPAIYRISRGSLIHGFTAVQATHQAAYDEDMQRVQRSHWLATALDREDVGGLGALFDIPILPWEPTELYRTRLRATIAARLRGAVTRDVLEFVLIQILSGAIESLGVRYFDVSAALRFHTGPTDEPRTPAFVEFPKVLRRSEPLMARRGLLPPLTRFQLVNLGLHPTPLQTIIRGVAGGLCVTPVLINLTNGRVLTYAGPVPCGKELRIGTKGRNQDLIVTLDGEDAKDSLFTGKDFKPGAEFSPVLPDPTPEPMTLERGANDMWFFPLALFNKPSLGSGVLGMPDLEISHGRFAGKSEKALRGTTFDSSLFEQQAAASFDVWWIEDRPASFRFEIPAGAVIREADARGNSHQDRLRLFDLLQQTITLMRAAGVEGTVEARPLRESQQQRDRLRVLPPIVAQEEVRSEARLSAVSGLFDTSALDNARLA